MRKLKRFYYVIVATIVILIGNNIYGATSISVSNSSPKVGQNITVSIKVSGVASWQLNVSYDSSKLTLISGDTTLVRADNGIKNVNTTAGTLVFKAKATGSANIKVSGNSYTETYATANSGASINVNIVAPSNTSNTTTTTKSSNANLKSMSVNIGGLSPAFSKNQTSYSLKVGENVNEIRVTAAVENSKASYSVSGNKDLKVGENIVKVTVTAENGTKKVYKITVLKSDNPILSDATLANLIIEDANIGEFNPDITEYNAGNLKVISKLNILAYPTNEKAKIEIIGNDNLKVGENVVIIKVTSENEKGVKEYTLTFNNKEIEKSIEIVNIYNETSSLKNDNYLRLRNLINTAFNYLKKYWVVILLLFVCVLEFICIIVLSLKNKKLKETNKTIEPGFSSETIETTTRRRGNAEDVKDENKEELIEENKEEPTEETLEK